MRAKVLNEFAGTRKYALTFDRDDEIISGLAEFAKQNGLHDASFSGLGTLGCATLAWFNEAIKQYAPIPIEEQVEVLMLNGRISAMNGKPDISAHVVIGKSDGTAHGGHLLRATVYPKADLFIEETRPRMHRSISAESCVLQTV